MTACRCLYLVRDTHNFGKGAGHTWALRDVIQFGDHTVRRWAAQEKSVDQRASRRATEGETARAGGSGAIPLAAGNRLA